MAAAEGDDTDIFAYHAEPPLVAVNLFHLRKGKIVDRREFFWEDQEHFDPAEFFDALLKQVYVNSAYIPGHINVPIEFEECGELEEYLSEAARTQGGNCHSATRLEKGDAQPG